MSSVTVMLYPCKGRFYIQDPVSKQKKWLTLQMYRELKQYCKFQIFKKPPALRAMPRPKKVLLVPYYIAFNTADRNMLSYPTPSRFAVPLYPSKEQKTSKAGALSNAYRQSLPPRSKIMGVRLHQAVVPKSQQVVHANNRHIYLQRNDTSATYTVVLDVGHFSANDIGRVMQAKVRALGLLDFTVALNLVTGRFDLTSTSTSFRVLQQGTSAARLLGLVFDPKTDSADSSFVNGLHVLRTQHADVSGSQMLVVTVEELKDKAVAHIPLFDLGAGGIVYYHNPETGGKPMPTFLKPRSFGLLTCSCRDETGLTYNFNGVNATYVFEILCLELKL